MASSAALAFCFSFNSSEALSLDSSEVLALCFFGLAGVVAEELLGVDVVAAGAAAGAGDDMLDEDELLAAKAAPPMAAANTMAGMANFKVRIKFSLVSAEAPARRGEQIRPEPNPLLTQG